MLLFDVERDAEGNAKIVPPKQVEPSPKQIFRRRCYVNGITDQATVDRLWAERQADRKMRTERTRGAKKGRRK